MQYWLNLFTPYTWTRFKEKGANVSGFGSRQHKAAFERVKKGDLLLCYLVKLSRWCGVLEVAGDAFKDATPLFADTNDPFTIRFKVKPKIILDFAQSVPIQEPELWQELSFTRTIAINKSSWAVKLRQSLVQLASDDGSLINRVLERQTHSKRDYPLDASDRRQIRSVETPARPLG
jgi:EVE domain